MVFEYNTVAGSPLALASNAGPYEIHHNNLMPVVEPGLIEPTDHDAKRNAVCIGAGQFRPAIGDPWQEAFIASFGGVPVTDVFSVTDNYFGATDPAAIEQCLDRDAQADFEFAYQPFETTFIDDALPDWHEFDWLAPPPDDLCLAAADYNVNLRAGPGTDYAAVGQLLPGQYASVTGQAVGDDQMVWWALAPGLWIRSDVVEQTGDCTTVPDMIQ